MRAIAKPLVVALLFAGRVDAVDVTPESSSADAARPAEETASPPNRWPMFRGVGSSVTAASGLPIEWSETENVAWRTELPGYGQSSPIVWDRYVFATTMQGDQKQTPTLAAFDLQTGEELWRDASDASQTVAVSDYVSRGAPTPCVDDRGVYAFFESGDLVACSHSGKRLWRRSLVEDYGRIEGNHGVGGSPVLVGGLLIVPITHGGPCYLLAVDPLTGETRWKADLDVGVAWSSLSAIDHAIVLSAGGAVQAFDFAGERLWRFEGLEGNNVPSPTAGSLLLIGAQGKGSNLALDTAGEVVWRAPQATSSFASPLAYRGRAYYLSRAGVAQCYDSESGEELWKERLGDSCWASPLGAEGRVYFFSKGGETTVYAAEGDSEVIAKNQLSVPDGSRVYGVAAVDGKLLVRTGSELVCLANAD